LTQKNEIATQREPKKLSFFAPKCPFVSFFARSYTLIKSLHLKKSTKRAEEESKTVAMARAWRLCGKSCFFREYERKNGKIFKFTHKSGMEKAGNEVILRQKIQQKAQILYIFLNKTTKYSFLCKKMLQFIFCSIII